MENNTKFSIILSSRAQKEVTKAWEWYEDKKEGLGDRFIKSLISRLQLIEQYPDRYPTRFKSYKEAIVPVFPFLIIYRINRRKSFVRIVSIFHTSLNPKKKFN